MKLEKAIERLKDDVKHADLRDTVDDDCTICFIEDIETVLQEIEALQKSNAELQKEKEELKNMDLTTVYINGVEDEKSKILELIDFGVKATNTNDEYSIGMCNGMLYIKSVILDREIKYKECPKNSISKDKIREKIEELKHADSLKVKLCHQHDNKAMAQIEVLEDLLKEE